MTKVQLSAESLSSLSFDYETETATQLVPGGYAPSVVTRTRVVASVLALGQYPLSVSEFSFPFPSPGSSVDDLTVHCRLVSAQGSPGFDGVPSTELVGHIHRVTSVFPQDVGRTWYGLTIHPEPSPIVPAPRTVDPLLVRRRRLSL